MKRNKKDKYWTNLPIDVQLFLIPPLPPILKIYYLPGKGVIILIIYS